MERGDDSSEGADAKRPLGDLVLSEQFHRLKRTALIFCSVIVVTIIPGVDFNAASQSVWAPFKGVSHVWALLLLYVGACYYSLGFLGEYVAAHRQNAELLIDRTGAHLAQVLKDADRAASAAMETLNEAVNGLPGLTAPEIIGAVRQDVATTLEMRFPMLGFAEANAELHALSKEVQERINAMDVPISTITYLGEVWDKLRSDATQVTVTLWTAKQDEIMREIRHGRYGAGPTQPLDQLLSAVKAQQNAVGRLQSALPGLRGPLATLNRYGAARTLTFWLWEGLAVLSMWAMATLIFLWNAPELFGLQWWFQG